MNNLKYNGIKLEEKKMYSGLNLLRYILDGRQMAINKKYLAMSSINDGEIDIFDSSKSYGITNIQSNIKINDNQNRIFDIEFSPFNDNILALAYENKSVVLWKIPEGNINKNTIKEFQIYKKHNEKVNYVTFNPVVDNVLCSDSFDNEIHVWNIDKGDHYIKFNIDENPSMISWNPNGDLIGVTSRKDINIFDPRNKNFIIKQDIFERFHPPQFAWIDNNLLVATVNNNNSKMLKLWDIRKPKNSSLNEGEIASIVINKLKKRIFTPFVNRELKIIYIIGKEKSNINLYNYSENKITKIENYNISEPSICSALFNRTLLDKNKKEIDRFVICTKDNNIYYSSFYLPKETEISDSILYPIENHKILSYEDWIEGKNSFNNNGENVKENKINNNKQTENKIINEKDKKIENEEKKLNNEENENDKLYNDLLNKFEKLKKRNKKLKEKNKENKAQLELKIKENEEKQHKINELETNLKEEEKKYEELRKKYEQEKKEKEKLDKDLLEEKKKNENLININIYDDLNKKYKELIDKQNNYEKLCEDLKNQLEEANNNLIL